MRLQLFLSLLLVSCSPDSYEECLVDLGRSRSAGEAMALCRDAFPELPEPAEFYSGTFFYLTDGPQCASISFSGTGEIVARDRGYCGEGSRVECEGDECWFTCTNYNASDTAAVTLIEPSREGIAFRISSSGEPTVQLYAQRSSCELAQKRVNALRATTLEERLGSTLPPGVTSAMLNEGESIFTGVGNCYTCHGMDARGTQLAPNLTDPRWINVDGSFDAVLQLIRTGVAAPRQHPAPMPPSGGAYLTDHQLRAVTAYVWSISRETATGVR